LRNKPDLQLKTLKRKVGGGRQKNTAGIFSQHAAEDAVRSTCARHILDNDFMADRRNQTWPYRSVDQTDQAGDIRYICNCKGIPHPVRSLHSKRVISRAICIRVKLDPAFQSSKMAAVLRPPPVAACFTRDPCGRVRFAHIIQPCLLRAGTTIGRRKLH